MGADIIKKELPVTLVPQTILQAEKIYEEHLIRDFPDNEVKPFAVIEAAMRGGRYQVFAAMLDGELAGYAFLAAGSPAESADLPAGLPAGASLPVSRQPGRKCRHAGWEKGRPPGLLRGRMQQTGPGHRQQDHGSAVS